MKDCTSPGSGAVAFLDRFPLTEAHSNILVCRVHSGRDLALWRRVIPCSLRVVRLPRGSIPHRMDAQVSPKPGGSPYQSPVAASKAKSRAVLASPPAQASVDQSAAPRATGIPKSPLPTARTDALPAKRGNDARRSLLPSGALPAPLFAVLSFAGCASFFVCELHIAFQS